MKIPIKLKPGAEVSKFSEVKKWKSGVLIHIGSNNRFGSGVVITEHNEFDFISLSKIVNAPVQKLKHIGKEK